MSIESPIQILLVEDSPTDILLTEEALSNGRFHLKSCQRLGDAFLQLETQNFSVVILDLGLPDSQGLETLRSLRAKYPHVAIIVFTGKDDEVLAVQALKEGAQDYLVKGQGLNDILRRAIRYAIERKRAEESLKLFRTLIDHTNDSIEVIDPSTGRFLDINQKGCDDLQYSRDEILDLSVEDIDPEVAKLGWSRTARNVLTNGSAVMETQHRRKDGSVFPVEINSKLVNLDRKYLVAVVRDISERKKAEEALHQSEERFRQAQKMEAIGQLAGGVAHDFNNLLTIISGYSELLSAKMGPQDPMRESVKAISEAGDRAASLTRQLLAFSRKAVLEPKVLDLNEVVRETDKLLRRLIGEDLHLTAVLDPGISRVKVDPGQLGQVLMNLAVNARDAMPTGGKLTVETRNVDIDREYERLHPDSQPGRYVLLSMTDTGCGMTADV